MGALKRWKLRLADYVRVLRDEEWQQARLAEVRAQNPWMFPSERTLVESVKLDETYWGAIWHATLYDGSNGYLVGIPDFDPRNPDWTRRGWLEENPGSAVYTTLDEALAALPEELARVRTMLANVYVDKKGRTWLPFLIVEESEPRSGRRAKSQETDGQHY
jgi:hypothetical protein